MIDAYQAFFDEVYRKREGKIGNDLGAIVSDFGVDRLSSLIATMSNNRVAMAAYEDLRSDTDEAKYFNAVSARKSDLVAAAEAFRIACKGASNMADELRRRKLTTPHEAVEPYDSHSLLGAYDALVDAIEDYGASAMQLNERLDEFKAQNQSAPLSARIEAKAARVQKFERRKKRIELDEQCRTYLALTGELANNRDEVRVLEQQLNIQQSQYLEHYFDRLNDYFSKFGSHEFVLSRRTDNRGHQPVFSLLVNYRGEDIPETSFERLFSESDRRALALSIFWAQIGGLSDAEAATTILVLDDHVTSFDEHRTSTVHSAVAQAASRFRQVIVLAHYKPALRRFVEAHGSSLSPKLLQLVRRAGASELKQLSREDLLLDEHLRVAHGLFEFINESGPNPGVAKLRIFLEKEIENRFAEQFRRHSIDAYNLSGRIDAMADARIISENLKADLHRWRETLNPDHHTWTSASESDQRNTTRLLVQFIYTKLVPA